MPVSFGLKKHLNGPRLRFVTCGMKSAILCLMAFLVLPSTTSGQERRPSPSTYRLRFTLKESGVDGKTTTRSYDIVVQGGSRAKINASHRLPFYTSSKGEAKEVHTAALGSIVECTPGDEEGERVQLNCAFESSYVAPSQPAPPSGLLPMVNARQVSTTATVDLGREQYLAGLDDPSSNNRLEILVLVERVSGTNPPR